MPIGKDSIKTRVAKVTAAEMAEEILKTETPAAEAKPKPRSRRQAKEENNNG